jgi:hypothetical protein
MTRKEKVNQYLNSTSPDTIADDIIDLVNSCESHERDVQEAQQALIGIKAQIQLAAYESEEQLGNNGIELTEDEVCLLEEQQMERDQ